MAGRRRFRSTSRRSGRFVWTYDSLATVGTSGQGVQAITTLLANLSTSVKTGSLIQRMHLVWSIRSPSTGAVVKALLGIYITKIDHIGVSSPELEVDEWNYLVLDRLTVERGATGPQEFTRREVDFRASRKIRSLDDRLVLQVENISDAANNIEFDWGVRTLLWVP